MSGAGEPGGASPARSRRALLAGGLALLLAGGCLALGLSLRRGPVDLPPLEADLQDARRMLGRSGRAEWAVRAARDASERLRWAKAWNQALQGGAPADQRDEAWAEYQKHTAAAAESLPAARDEMRLLAGERW